MTAPSYDAVVIGAGISGAASALELALSGVRVALIDRYAPAAMASGWTLAGVRQSGRHPAELPLAVQAVKLWQDLADRLDAPTHYRQRGNLRCARDAGEAAIIDQLIAEQSAAGLEMIRLEGRAIKHAAPALSDRVVLASLCPTDGQADPRASGDGFKRAPVGTGPFMFKSVAPSQSLELVANDAYFRGKPKISAISYRFMPSGASRDLAFQDGEIDLGDGAQDQKWVARMKAVPHVVTDVMDPAELSQIYLDITSKPLDDIGVRQAIDLAPSRPT